MGSLNGGPKEISSQMAAVKALHTDLQNQQPLVDSLSTCVVVVDDDQQDNGIYCLMSKKVLSSFLLCFFQFISFLKGVCEIEDQLRALSERWALTCQWTETQLNKLQALQSEWKALDQQYEKLLQWITDKEIQLKQVIISS